MDRDFWKDKEALRAAVNDAGSMAACARAAGISVQTVSSWWNRHGLPKVPDGRKPNLIPSPEREVDETEHLRAEVTHLRRVAGRHRSEDVVTERYAQVLAETVQATVPTWRPKKAARSTKANTAHTFALQWSDLHASEVVSAEEMNGINSYDWDEMLARHDRLRDGILSFKQNRPYPVEGLHILALGDMVTGDIHDELRVTNEKVATEAAVQLGVDMGEWLDGLAQEFPWIKVSCVFGNHGRLTQKPSFKQAYNNWDWLFYTTLAARMRHTTNVEFQVSRAAQMPVEVCGKRILLWHGDGVRTSMPGVPWGGIIRRCNELERGYAAVGTPIDHFAVGHWHEANVVRDGRILMNGSVKGQDEYAMARFGGGSPARQLLATFHPEYGLTDVSFMGLQE